MAPLLRYLRHHLLRSHFSTGATASPSSILNPTDPSAPLTAKQKTHAAIALLRSESDASRILSICRAASLHPSNPLDRHALSLASSHLSSDPSSLRSLLLPLLPHPHVFTLLAKSNLLPDALQAFKSHPTVSTLNSLLFAAILSNRHQEAAKYFQELPAAHGVTPNLTTFNTLIKSFAESGSSRSVSSLLDEMGRRKIKPNMTTFTNWLSGLYREEKFDDVPKVLELMKKYDCHPTLTTYNVRIQGLCKLGRLEEANKLFKEMMYHGMKPNWLTYNHLMFAYCKEGNLQEAKRLYKEMKRKGCVPDSKFYFTLVYYLCQGGDFETALGVCKDCMKKNWVPSFSTMKMLVNGLVKESKLEEAREIMGIVKEKFSSNAEMWKEVEEALPQ